MKQVDVVGAIITNENNEILCALRSKHMSQPGYWEFPGGKIENGEDHKEAFSSRLLLCNRVIRSGAKKGNRRM